MSETVAVGQVWHHKAFGTRAVVVWIRDDEIAVSRPLGAANTYEKHPDSYHGPGWTRDEFLAKWWPEGAAP